MKQLALPLLAAVALFTSNTGQVFAGGTQPDAKEVKAVLNKAITYLKSAQNADGSFAPKLAGPGVSALVVAGLLRNGVSVDDPLVAKTMKYLEKNIQKDGGIYNKFLANYVTSVSVMAFAEANKNGRYDKVLKNAAKFLKGLQHDEPESLDKNVEYGGYGYDGGSRPDASNTIYTVDALLAAGVPKDDPAIQKAMIFLKRCQNLPKESNDQPFAAKTTKDDHGGLTYTPTDVEKNSYKTPAGGLRSLGSMTYGGLKSFLYAGIKKDDPRVKAAVDWARRHYTLEENPGLGKAGLYYYYHTFGKAMDALGEDTFTDANGTKHQWRNELFKALKSRQQPNGSWQNKGDKRFGESFPELATAFAILTLSYTRED